jgi:hypothetical protein
MAANTNQSLDEPTNVESLAGDLLVGGDVIEAFVIEQGLPETTDVYYLRKIGWPIGKLGPGQSAPLAASKKSILNYIRKLIAA